MIITLTTDFGLSDPFVGIMKGVILSIAPDVDIVDITHDIEPYGILAAALTLNTSYPYFPKGTVHIVVVDPGVGTTRRGLAALYRGQYFVGPDNGVLPLGLPSDQPDPSPVVHTILNQTLFHHPVSRTFHGRDVFAPVAAHMARGTPLDSVGSRVEDFLRTPIPLVRRTGAHGLKATVLRVDRFGNVMTNLRRPDLPAEFRIQLAGTEVTGLSETFADARNGNVVAIEGSTGYVELAIWQGSAADRLRISAGAEIEVETGLPNH